MTRSGVPLAGGQVVGGSNPLAPTIPFPSYRWESAGRRPRRDATGGAIDCNVNATGSLFLCLVPSLLVLIPRLAALLSQDLVHPLDLCWLPWSSTLQSAASLL